MSISAVSANSYLLANPVKNAGKQAGFEEAIAASISKPAAATFVRKAVLTGQNIPGVATSDATNAALPVLQDVDTNASAPDFTDMTRKEIFDWMNRKITSGEMTLDESSPFLGMTVKISINGGTSGLDDQERVNFVDLTHGAIDWYRSRGDSAQVERWLGALEIMGRYQG